ncbi:hypothetical protein Acr_28g0012610 [Actinidia rufa]|uniref:Chitinase 1 n=1 Tax=Actinidia rufa TaxID=165716 RepID=A0A7J0HBV0_9ERIC|nr:hypothetical protein Acr_28g0012610 [Actinidia rufa]
MESSKLFFTFFILQSLLVPSIQSANSDLFREYIGAEFNNIRFSDTRGFRMPSLRSQRSSKSTTWTGLTFDYEHFKADPETFAECIGKLITTLKQNGVISFASIAPFDDDQVQSHYLALWRSYGRLIDYVNFQFYAYDQGTTVDQFISYFQTQSSNYNGGKVLASFATDGSGGLSPENGFLHCV